MSFIYTRWLVLCPWALLVGPQLPGILSSWLSIVSGATCRCPACHEARIKVRKLKVTRRGSEISECKPRRLLLLKENTWTCS
ncbi:hypothetical protein EV426DRAFT_624828 [Tirmania nivea]|nr:hypothetical protein EV426DRAFT_624828 [Tirmania nivea]